MRKTKAKTVRNQVEGTHITHCWYSSPGFNSYAVLPCPLRSEEDHYTYQARGTHSGHAAVHKSRTVLEVIVRVTRYLESAYIWRETPAIRGRLLYSIFSGTLSTSVK